MSSKRNWRDFLQELPPYAPSAILDADHLGLVVVDMQHSSVGRDSVAGKFLKRQYPVFFDQYFAAVDKIVPQIVRLVRYFRDHKRRIIFLTVSSHLPDGGDFEPQREQQERHLESETGQRAAVAYQGQPDARIIEALTPSVNDLVLNKVSLGAFNSTGLDQLLRNLRISSLVVTGVVTNGCVAATAFDAADRGYHTILVEDACAAIDPILHEATLLNFAHLYGRVLTTEQVLEELGIALAPARELVADPAGDTHQ